MPRGNLRALVIDKDPAMRRLLHRSLSDEGYAVSEADSGRNGLSTVATFRPEIVVLDLNPPDLDGLEVTKLLRQWTGVPIVILSDSVVEARNLAALDAGADDFLIKPFSIDELLARMRAALRRAGRVTTEPVFAIGLLTVDVVRRTVKLDGREVALTPTEFELLRLLVTNAGKVMTHGQLLRAVWGSEHEGKTHLLQVNISNLRDKLEPAKARYTYIRTVPGVGYRLDDGF